MKLNRIVIWLGLLIVVIYGVLRFDQIEKIANLLIHIKWYYLALLAAIQVIAYFSLSEAYILTLKIYDRNLKVRKILPTILAMQFVNNILPSAGLAGTSYLIHRWQKLGIKASHTTLVQLITYILAFIAYLGTMVIGFGVVLATADIERSIVRLTVIATSVIFLALWTLVLLFYDQNRGQKIARRLYDVITKPLAFMRRKITARDLEQFIKDLYTGLDETVRHRRKLIPPMLWFMAYFWCQIVTLFIIFLAFGQLVNLGMITTSYVVTNVLSLSSVATSGVGIYEASMVASFVAFGLPFADALTAVLIYRAIAFWLFMPIGFYFYRRTLA